MVDGGDSVVEDLRQRVRNLEAISAAMQTQVAVNAAEIANANRRITDVDKRIDNVEAEHARFPQMTISIIALIVSAVATLGSLFAAGILGP